MSSNIYNINFWVQNTQYNKDDIITDGVYYYYSSINHTSSSSFATDYSNGLWNGIISNNGETKPYFIWVPSYKYINDSVPKVRTIQFGDGYIQDVRDGINNLLLSSEFRFENINLNECTAILHFLYTRAGTESFVFLTPAPYSVLKRFKCKQWQDTENFYNNYTITAKFNEVVV